MQIEEHRWFSKKLDQEMALKVYGHWGAPILVFPCSRGRYYDYETMGMVAAIADFIDGGQVKLFCVDSVDAQSWYDFSVPPATRNRRHEDYESYIIDEVVPFIHSHCGGGARRILTNGCSMGAYHALNFFLKHPERFCGTIALSGLYRLDRPEFGMNADDVPAIYFNSPVHYLAGMDDTWYLEHYRRSAIVICVGQGAWEEEALRDTRAMRAILAQKDVPAWVDFWGTDVNHDWPWWYRQMGYFLERVEIPRY